MPSDTLASRRSPASRRAAARFASCSPAAKLLADGTLAKSRAVRHGAQSFRRPKLLADEMLAKLARFMRIMGIPVKYIEGKTDDQILRVLKRNSHALLTSDEELASRCRKRSIPALYLPQLPVEKQVALVLSHFRLKLPPFPDNTLCPACGGKLKRVKKEALKGKIYPAVLKRRRLFWRCSCCSHIYWSGTHYQRLRKAYSNMRRLMR